MKKAPNKDKWDQQQGRVQMAVRVQLPDLQQQLGVPLVGLLEEGVLDGGLWGTRRIQPLSVFQSLRPKLLLSKTYST